jgi:hypothetical protein
MKKLILAVVLAAILATGTAFADHPSGFGIGVVGQFGWGIGGAGNNGGLSLKIPGLPIFWAVNFGAGSNYFAFGLTGDYYMIDQALPVQTLHWFLGLGGFFNLYAYNQTFYNSVKASYTHVDFGLRVPIGLSWQPIKLLELWLDIVPSFGIYIDGEGTYTYNNYSHTYHEGGTGFHWGLPLELGIRFWF